ncbi:hypothetical protein IAQ61_000626 [Plenodomus lingam]|uniref:uncharacterized protein n=1 Tax=Leptosphaeria maculans TaxID=5022 RepID=UPI00331BB001|nr:hypothetical protein IAQ61_000626 [Plenodomus lingam]
MATSTSAVKTPFINLNLDHLVVVGMAFKFHSRHHPDLGTRYLDAHGLSHRLVLANHRPENNACSTPPRPQSQLIRICYQATFRAPRIQSMAATMQAISCSQALSSRHQGFGKV